MYRRIRHTTIAACLFGALMLAAVALHATSARGSDEATAGGPASSMSLLGRAIAPGRDVRAAAAHVELAVADPASTARVVVLTGSGEAVRTLHDGTVDRPRLDLSWEGWSDAAVPVPDGPYVVEARVSHPDGSTARHVQAVRVDTTVPVATATSPTPRQSGSLPLLTVALRLSEEAELQVTTRHGATSRVLRFTQMAGDAQVAVPVPLVARRDGGTVTVSIVPVDEPWNVGRATTVRATIDKAPVAVSGMLAWPLRGTITSQYGERWGRFHHGIDVACSTGTPIRSAAPGRVSLAGWVSGYGNTIIVDHGNGLTTLYAHQSTLSVRAGATVATGTMVGACGSTGNSTGPHLHFEVRQGSNTINPLTRLP